MTVSDFLEAWILRWHTVIIADNCLEDAIYDALDSGGKIEDFFKRNMAYISLAPIGDYTMDAMLSERMAKAEVKHLVIEDAYAVLLVECESDVLT